ncbi:MAG: leucine-rich repeat domain-containing protein [Clostridia bacterium]|nr:leucine-rich repeat domain-containing protein [Clostridia bacterium]
MEDIKYEKLTLRPDSFESTCVIIDCEKDAQSVEIPLEVNGLLVVGIEEQAFKDCSQLEAVTFPCEKDYYAHKDFTSMFEIGDYAFNYCTSLKSIDIPCHVSFIGRGAFSGCSSLAFAHVPDCYIGPYAFYECKALETINPTDSISEGIFSGCEALKVFPVSTKTVEIEEDAFEHCYELVDITIPKGVERIGSLAFRSCYGLKRVTFENPEGWTWHCVYNDTDYTLDLSDPEKNAEMLSKMDFDDGCAYWERK